MEAIFSSETSVETQPTTRRHVPEDTLHNRRCENLKSYIIIKEHEIWSLTLVKIKWSLYLSV
jgi:hypothetical protein